MKAREFSGDLPDLDPITDLFDANPARCTAIRSGRRCREEVVASGRRYFDLPRKKKAEAYRFAVAWATEGLAAKANTGRAESDAQRAANVEAILATARAETLPGIEAILATARVENSNG